jgi:hypothetical protein
MEISNEVFEEKVHKIIINRGLKVNKSIVPSTWRPYDIVIEVNKMIQEENNECNFWNN